jgi:hypothetical protein
VSLSFDYFHFDLILLFSRCQLLSCTTEKAGKNRKQRKSRLRAFPTKWGELSKEHQDEIRRSLRKFTFIFFRNKTK